MKKFAVLFLILAVSAVSAIAGEFTGKVVGVSDGDTITVLTPDNNNFKIRLYGADCPESSQDYGQKAKQFTSDLCFGKQVSVQYDETDRYGRIVGIVTVDGKILSEELIKNGFAWTYTQYCKKSFCAQWKNYETEARQNKLGLWAGKNPTEPWNFRKDKKADKPAVSNTQAQPADGVFHGNSRSQVFHAQGCKDFNCKNCTVIFQTKEEAIKAGFRPHNQCVK